MWRGRATCSASTREYAIKVVCKGCSSSLDGLRYALDPADAMAPDYPLVTFPSLETKEIAERGEYSTQHRVLEAFEKMRS
jgi:hypothetical protein